MYSNQLFSWIVKIKENLEILFANDPNVFVAGDLLWYPVEGSNNIKRAPDAMTVFGRPKGYRGSYQQWLEDNIAPQVVFEILSPGNRLAEMTAKFEFYDVNSTLRCKLYFAVPILEPKSPHIQTNLPSKSPSGSKE
jgi:Uma2 family endonuclease